MNFLDGYGKWPCDNCGYVVYKTSSPVSNGAITPRSAWDEELYNKVIKEHGIENESS